MRSVKSFGILVEGYRGREGSRAIAREQMSRSGMPLGWTALSALEC